MLPSGTPVERNLAFQCSPEGLRQKVDKVAFQLVPKRSHPPRACGSTTPVALTRSEQMARIRGRNTSPEIRLRHALWARGLRYRLHAPTPAGRPDRPEPVGAVPHRDLRPVPVLPNYPKPARAVIPRRQRTRPSLRRRASRKSRTSPALARILRPAEIRKSTCGQRPFLRLGCVVRSGRGRWSHRDQ